MHNLRTILFTAALTIIILACDLAGSPAPVPSGDGVATIVAATFQALTPAAPPSNPTPSVQGVPVSYKNVSFVLPQGLAADAAPQAVPALTGDNAGPWDVAPEHVNFRLDGYNAPDGHFTPINIDVYPAQEYASANSGANISLQRLQGALNDPSAALTNENLPQVPYFNAASMFAAQIQRVHFQSGDGVRLITQYGQAFGPIGNFGTFYHFEGLTADGKYYLVAVLPITAPLLQVSSDQSAQPPAGGVPFPGYNYSDPKYYDDYFKAITDKLNATPSDQFTPSLATLDALMQSFTVTP